MAKRDDLPPWDKELQTFRHRDLQRAVIVRGMPFEEVVRATHQGMQKFFCENYWVTQHRELLNEYDSFIERQLIAENKTPDNPEYAHLFHPSLKLGFVGERDEEGNIVKTKRVKGMKKEKKPPRDKNTKFNIFTGTAKELTYQCQSQGKSLADTLKLVKEKFPDRAEKSINIWYKRAKKAAKPS